ncbi:MAG: hypothetical protein ACJAXS_001631 [Colwellia sp.]|jgi:hypothetical protein
MKKSFRTGPKSDPARYKSHLSETTENIGFDNENAWLAINQEFDNVEKWINDERKFNENFLKSRNIPYTFKIYEYEKGGKKCNSVLSKYIADQFSNIAGAKLAGQNIELLLEATHFLDKGNENAALKNLYRSARANSSLVTANMEARFLSEQDRVSKIVNTKYSQNDYKKAFEIFKNIEKKYQARGSSWGFKTAAYKQIQKDTGISPTAFKEYLKQLK